MNDELNWLPSEEEEQGEAAQQSRRGLFRFLPRFRRGRGGASASAPSEESTASRGRGLFRLIPRFLRRARNAPTEATAADLALQMGEVPVEQLDDRLLALRDRALSRPQRETAPPREALYDVDDVLVRPEIIHRPGGVISPLALSKAQQEQVELLRDMVSGTALQDDGESEGGLLSRGGRAFSLGAIPHLLVSILMLLALALPFVSSGFSEGELPPLDFHEDRHGVTTAFNMLDNLTLDDYVLVAFEYGPTAAGELDELADVILRHIFAQGSKPIIVSSNPIAIVHARNVIAAIERSVAPVSTLLLENQDYYLLRFLSGGALGLRDLSRNFGSIVNTSARGQPTGLAFTSLDEMTLMVLIAERAEDIRHWAEQVAPETSSDFIAATGYAAQPLALPYVYAHEDIVGMLVGVRDAYTYNQKLQANYADFELPPRREDPGRDGEEAAPTPTPTATTTATATPTATPTDTATPEPQATPTPTPTEPEPELVQLAVAPAATATQTPSPVAEVIAQGRVNIRRRPNTASDILALAATGDTFPVLGENGDGSWINILLPDGIEAWIASFLVEQYLAPADGAGSSDDSARAGEGRTVLQFDFSLRLGKTRPRFYQADPPVPGDRAEFVLLRGGRAEEQRLDAMTLGTIAAVLVIVAGNVFYMMRALTRRRRASNRN
ncbi:MAG: SH3 domain-containing protein [Chloroflexi bacterium]|nr:SH3 domain-containing protein [Chloroflexota bacterium]